MRAILLLLIVGVAACGSNDGNTFELDLDVDAPQATSVLVDGTHMLPPGAQYSQGFTSVGAAMRVHGMVETLNGDGSVRASATYELGSYCDAETPLLRETLHFVESLDGNGDPQLALGSIECEKNDGTGTVVTP
ncbi:MAG TPA: hypothetical protein VGL86_28430 [Polyangia bacterium]|jgi:hypothetical protein